MSVYYYLSNKVFFKNLTHALFAGLFTRVFFLAAVCLFFLLSCNRSQQSLALRYSNGAEPESLDPHQATGQPGIRVIGALFEGLLLRKGTELEPGLAKSWELSADQKTYHFHLRKAKWSDNTFISAQDFVYSWQRLALPQTAAQYSMLLQNIKNAPQVLSGTFPPESLGVHAPNESTLVVELSTPTPYFLHLVAFEPLFPVPKKCIETHGPKWTKPENMINNGPFKIVSWKPNQKIELKRNPLYWDVQNVKQELIEVYPIEHLETAYKMYLSGELDWLFALPLGRMQESKKRSDYFNATQYGLYYYALNMTQPELQSPLLRRALALSINREELVEAVVQGGEKAAYTLVPPNSNPGYPQLSGSSYNPKLAQKLLAQDGYGPNKALPRLQIYYNTSEAHKKIAEVVAASWKKHLNIETDLQNHEWKIYLQNTHQKKYQIARASWIGDYPDPYTFLELFESKNGNNRTGYNNQAFDSCLKLAQQEVEPTLRLQKLASCEELLLTDLPFIPLYFYAQNEMRSPKLRGAETSPLGMYSWKHVHLSTNP